MAVAVPTTAPSRGTYCSHMSIANISVRAGRGGGGGVRVGHHFMPPNIAMLKFAMAFEYFHRRDSPDPRTGCLLRSIWRPRLLPEFDLEQSLDKDDAIATLHRLYPEHGAVADEYFDERADVIDELLGGRFSFQVRETRTQENKTNIRELELR